MKITGGATLAMTFICASACAATITVQGGLDHTPNSNYGDSGVVDVRAEQEVVENGLGELAVGAEIGYRGKQDHEPYGSISGTHLLGEAIYYPAISWKLRPYLLGGLGWSWWSWDRSAEMVDAGIDISTGDSLAKKVAIGADWPINAAWSLNIEWSYFHSHVPKESHYADGSLANVAGGDTIGQEETKVVLGLKRRF